MHMQAKRKPRRINILKRERTRAVLLNAAMTVFARLGSDAASIDDIIHEAAVARGTFYNYFASLEELLVALATQLSDELLARIGLVRQLPDPADRMACSIRSYIRRATADPTWGWVIVRIALVAAPLGTTMRGFLTADIEDGIAARRFRVPSVQVAADIVLGSAMMAMRSVLRGEAGNGHAEAVACGVLTAFGVADAAGVVRRSLDERAIIARVRRGKI